MATVDKMGWRALHKITLTSQMKRSRTNTHYVTGTGLLPHRTFVITHRWRQKGCSKSVCVCPLLCLLTKYIHKLEILLKLSESNQWMRIYNWKMFRVNPTLDDLCSQLNLMNIQLVRATKHRATSPTPSEGPGMAEELKVDICKRCGPKEQTTWLPSGLK